MNKTVIGPIVGVLVLGGAFFGFQKIANQEAEKGVKEQIEKINNESNSEIRYSDISSSFLSGKVNIEDVEVFNFTDDKIMSVSRLSIVSSSLQDAIPEGLSISLNDVVVQPEMRSQRNVPETFLNRPFNVNFSYDYNASTEALSTSGGISMEGAGSMSGDFNFGNFVSAWNELQQAGEEKRAFQMQRMGLEDLSIQRVEASLSNRGLREELLTDLSERMGVSEEQIKENQVRQIQQNRMIPDDAKESLIEFVTNSDKTLSLEMAPTEEVALLEIPQMLMMANAREGALDKLNFSLSVY